MKALQLRHFLLLVTFVTSIGTAVKPCSTATHIPVVNICRDETKILDATNSVLIKADDKQNCTCELHVINQDQDVTVNVNKYGHVASASPSAYGCGLIIEFEVEDTDWNAQCIVDTDNISMTITNNSFMSIRSFSVDGTLKQNEGYCFEIRKEVNNTTSNQLNLTCGIGSTSTTDTTQSEEKTTKMIQTTNPTTTRTTTKTTMPKTTTVPITTIIVSETTSTVPVITTTVPMTTTTTVPTRTTDFHTNNDDTEVLAVGASLGGLVIIIVVIAVICIYRRNHSKSAPKPNSKTGLTVNNDNDDYGLRENVLYIPADSTPKQTNDNWQNTNRISVDVDGNYSTVDLDEIPSVEESTGNYTSIELKKRTQSKSNLNGSKNEKPIIASKPKQKTTIQDVYSVPDKKRVKHVTAPGENGCEYAVVSKTNKSNDDSSEDQISTSNVYEVVEKKKRVSDGKGTNQKRDSFTAENDNETGQS